MSDAALHAFVTPALVAELMVRVAGDTLEVGPLRAGPGGIARAVARGAVGRPEVSVTPGTVVAVAAELPVEVELSVEATGRRYRFSAAAVLSVRADVVRDGDLAVVGVAPLTADDVGVKVTPHGLQARLVRRVGDVDGEIRRQVAAYVNGRLADADVQAMLRVSLP